MKNFFLSIIVLSSLILGLTGAFITRHPDSEFEVNRVNKTCLIHSLYCSVSKIEYCIHKNFLHDTKSKSLYEFMRSNRKNALSLYFFAVFFCVLGIIFTYLTALKITNDESIGLIASLFLGSSFFWTSELHYPTVDLATTSLVITSFYFILIFYDNKRRVLIKEKIFLGFLIGLAISAKSAAILLFIPLLIIQKKIKDLMWIVPISLITFSIFISRKLLHLKDTVKTEITTMFSSGYLGYENPTGHTFLYHIQTSLMNQYGLLLLFFALIALFSVKEYFKTKKDSLVFFSFPLLVYLVMGSIKLQAPRYILLILPFLTILSAIGLVTSSKYLSHKLHFKESIISIVLITVAIFPNLVLSIKHDSLLLKTSTEDQAYASIGQLHTGSNIIFSNPTLFLLPDGLRNLNHSKIPSSLDCNNQHRIDFKEKYFNNPNNVVVFDSFWTDRFIYDWRFKCSTPRTAFANFDGLYLYQINPFTTNKDNVPFSPESRFSPKLPDINYRKQHGPFYEIFIQDHKLARHFENICKKYSINIKRTNSAQSYYLNRIEGFQP